MYHFKDNIASIFVQSNNNLTLHACLYVYSHFDMDMDMDMVAFHNTGYSMLILKVLRELNEQRSDLIHFILGGKRLATIENSCNEKKAIQQHI